MKVFEAFLQTEKVFPRQKKKKTHLSKTKMILRSIQNLIRYNRTLILLENI